MPTKRIVLEREPAVDSTYHHEGSPWASRWIAHPEQGAEQTAVVAYRLKFTLPAAMTIRCYVSADQRYELFVDGERAGRGPERGDPQNWFFEAYDVDLAAGEHVIVARTWWLHHSTPSPYAQMTVRPGFWFHAEGEHQKLLSTGLGAWEAKILDGYAFSPIGPMAAFTVVGARTKVDGAKYPWGFEKGEGDGWTKANGVGIASPAWLNGEWPAAWLLRPGTLPALYEATVHPGVARWVGNDTPGDNPIKAETHLKGEESGWNALLKGDGNVTVPANTTRRVIVDLQNYYCAYPKVTTTGGAGAVVQVRWAESLFVPGAHPWEKRNRDEIEGKVFRGMGDTFTIGGGSEPRGYEPLWWEAGRYVEFSVKTAGEPLTIDGFALQEVHYPHQFESHFESAEPRMSEIIPLAERVLEMCSHETYMDCPYYEQLMYVGDTRLEVLVTYAATRDERLPRKALHTFDMSRTTDGLTHARYPTRVRQFIPPFSLWWVGMVYDYAMWRDDVAFVRDCMPGVRAVLDAYRTRVDDKGLLLAMPGWNFTDWVVGWASGVPPTGADKPVATINFQFAWVLRQAAELEELIGEPEMGARNRRTADAVTKAANDTFWDEKRGLYAEDLDHQHFSQHAQCLALLGDAQRTVHLSAAHDGPAAGGGEGSASGAMPVDRRPRVVAGLFSDQTLAPTTIYFTHYFFETCRLTHRMDAFFKRLEPWYELKKLGFKTTVEMPEPSRSDCHAWGAHPVYHYYATVLGIRPGSAGFRTVRIEPQLGALKFARGTMVHPKGTIKVDLTQEDGGRLRGTIDLPDGVSGQLVLADRVVELNCGPTRL
jgi:hypothetical protein